MRRGGAAALAAAAVVASGAAAAQVPSLPGYVAGPEIKAGETLLPSPIDTGARYLIYLPARITEEQGPEAPVSKQFGPYDFNGILTALNQEGFRVVSDPRPPGTDAVQYADVVVDQVRGLIRRGVPAEHVTVAGFSKGAVIALFAAKRVADPRVSYVIMAGCPKRNDPKEAKTFQALTDGITGRILSLYEASDTLAGSCKAVFDRGRKDLLHQETVFHGVNGHGYFYTVKPAWVKAVADWGLGPGAR